MTNGLEKLATAKIGVDNMATLSLTKDLVASLDHLNQSFLANLALETNRFIAFDELFVIPN